MDKFFLSYWVIIPVIILMLFITVPKYGWRTVGNFELERLEKRVAALEQLIVH